VGQSAYSRAVQRAAEIAGGVEQLATELGISRPFLQACITGSQATPVPIFLKVVDFLMDRDIDAGTTFSAESRGKPFSDEQISK
jgi:hypothetical protein